MNTDACTAATTFTVTKGIEWTPRGYRTFAKVDGFHNDLVVFPKDQIEIWTHRQGTAVVLSGNEENPYFEYLEAGDNSTILEQVSIAHAPNPLNAGTWGITNPSQSTIRTRMKIDYIRLWQPTNHYSDMEPVYQ